MSTIADRERRLRELAAANVAVGSEASLEDVLQKTADVAARLVNARYAALGVLDRTGSRLERLITTGIDDATRTRIGDLPSDHGVLRILLREARPVRVADVTKEPHFFGFPPGHPPMRSFLGVPIFVRGVVYGDLYLAEKEVGEFTEADQEIATLLAAQTGITIEKVQIHEGATHWIRQLEALDELGRSFVDASRAVPVVGALISAEARQAEQEIAAGNYRGPLHGIPVAVKDLLAMQGTVTTAGSKVFATRVIDYDAAAVARLRAAGAIIIGEVLAETGRVREELGWPIVMTPFAQMLQTQAVMNVTGKERYAVIPDEIIRYAIGRFPLPPGLSLFAVASAIVRAASSRVATSPASNRSCGSTRIDSRPRSRSCRNPLSQSSN